MITDKIKKRTDKTQEDSGWNIVFEDKSTLSEKESSWNDFSENTIVDYMGNKRIVMISKYNITQITVFHKNSSTTINPQNGDSVYHSIRAVTGGNGKSVILGRVIGIVNGGKIIEERFLNGKDTIGIKI